MQLSQFRFLAAMSTLQVLQEHEPDIKHYMNLPETSGYFKYYQNLPFRVNVCVLYVSQNKQRLFPYTERMG